MLYGEPILERIAIALANMEKPDLSDVEEGDVYRAVRQIWEGGHANKDWLKQFKEKISQLSHGRVTLRDADSSTFHWMARGPDEYLELVSDVETQKFTFGPYGSPVSFDD